MTSQLPTRIAQWIIASYTRHSITRESLSQQLGVHRNTVIRWEQGYPIKLADFVALCGKFGEEPGRVLERLVREAEGR